MGELLRNAWMGWQAFSGAGKLGALLLLVFLLAVNLGLGSRGQRELLCYGGVMTALCIFPPTAAVIMLYQTRFYDYEWVWTAVPLTAVVACGGILLLEWLRGTLKGKRPALMAVCGAVLVMTLLCGRLGNQKWMVEDVAKERQEVAKVLEMLKDGGDETICLWAPREVMTHVRSLDGNVFLLYGRDMWQEHLNAYSYDVYSTDRKELYVWMLMAQKYGILDVPVDAGLTVAGGEGPEAYSTLYGLSCIQKAIDLGANRILLPGNLPEEMVAEIGNALGTEPMKLGTYWLLRVDEENDGEH